MHETRDIFDVAIVGGGMVGASLACALGGTPLRVALIEAVPLGAAAQPSYDDRTVTLAHGSKCIFEGIGLWPQVLRRGVGPIRHIHISERGHLGITHLDADKLGVEALGYVVANRALGAALYETLSKQANINLLCPARVRALQFDADGAALTIAQGEAQLNARARLVIGADGARSQVRALANIGARETDYQQTAIVTNITTEYGHRQTAYERFTADGPLALLPLHDDRCATIWTLRPKQAQEIMALPEDAFRLRLHTQFGDRLGGLLKCGNRQAYPLALIHAQEIVRPRLVLAGNAAHSLHPVAAQGLNLGLRDVATLAEILVDATRRREDIGALTLLQHYARLRQSDAQRMIAFTHGLVRLFSSDLLPVTLARRMGLLAMDLLPPLKRRLMRRSMGLAGWLPRLARGLPL